jgi:hypothetical protein
MAKENKPAEAYAANGTDFELTYTPGSKVISELNISVGGLSKGNYPPENKNGEITMRGAGAATKGKKLRGPVA